MPADGRAGGNGSGRPGIGGPGIGGADGAAERRAWVAVRRHLVANRHDLTRLAARLYPTVPAVAGTRLLARPGWILRQPAPLEDIALIWEPEPLAPDVDPSGPPSLPLRPRQPSGRRFDSYADALGALDGPAVFENRTCYRLLEVLPGVGAAPRLVFAGARYFDGINSGEAVAHELAAATIGSPEGPHTPPALRTLGLRRLIGDPCDPGRRPMLPAISVLTVRSDRRRGDARMLLHWRDPARVAANSGLFQVVPVGVFQPSAEGRWNVLADLDLERCVVREMSEELLGRPERPADSPGAMPYDDWPFYQAWRAARRAGSLRLSWLGLGVDPLTLSTDLLVVAVFDAPVFDEMFADLVRLNAEGEVVALPFTAEEVLRYSTVEPMQPAGTALLRLAWQHRGVLLDGPD